MIDTYKKNRPCPKCRTLGVTTSYCSAEGKRCWAAADYAPHMHRACINCNHTFYERPADADGELYTQKAIESRAASHRLWLEERKAAYLNLTSPPPRIGGGVGAGRPWWKP